MIDNAALVGLMVSLWIGVVLTWHSLTVRVGSAAHYGGHDAVSVDELRRRIAAEEMNRVAVRMDSYLSAWSHDAPGISLTVSQTHDVMQLHRECRMENCDRKRAAYWMLVAEGRIRPDGRAERTAER